MKTIIFENGVIKRDIIITDYRVGKRGAICIIADAERIPEREDKELIAWLREQIAAGSPVMSEDGHCRIKEIVNEY